MSLVTWQIIVECRLALTGNEVGGVANNSRV